MKIYVKSRGASQAHEYEWVNQSQQEDEPSIINRSFLIEPDLSNEIRITDLHSLEQPAIIVLRDREDLVILLTGIKAGWNAPGGAVYHSVAWLSCEEKFIRTLAIYALKGELQHNVISAVTLLDHKPGFQVDFGKLERFSFDESFSLGEQSGSFETGELAKNVPEFRDKLASELKNTCLPEKSTFLIVVSDFVSDSLLENIDVWRGLTSRLQKRDWVEFDLKKNLLPSHLAEPSTSQAIQEKSTVQPSLVWKRPQIWKQAKTSIWGLGLLMIGILTGLIIAFIFLETKPPSIPVEQPLQENQTLNLLNQASQKSLPSPGNQAPMNQQILHLSYQSHQVEQSQLIFQRNSFSMKEFINL